ncbi:MAG: transposase [Planctomycetota bacterium]
MDLRERVVDAYDRKTGTQAEVAARFDVSVSWLKKLLRFRLAFGSIAPKPHGGGHAPKFSGERLEELKKFVEQDPGATLAELLERSKVDASIMAVHRALERLDCRFKKSRCTRLNKSAQTSKPSGMNGASRLRK